MVSGLPSQSSDVDPRGNAAAGATVAFGLSSCIFYTACGLLGIARMPLAGCALVLALGVFGAASVSALSTWADAHRYWEGRGAAQLSRATVLLDCILVMLVSEW